MAKKVDTPRMLRLIITAVAAIGGGVAAGRHVLDKSIKSRVSTEVDAAKERAILELNKSVDRVLAEKIRTFVINVLIKVAVVAAIYVGLRLNYLTPDGFRVISLLAIAAFVTRDVLNVAPYVVPAFRLARRHGWSPRKIVTETVAATVFERAYAEVLVEAEKGTNRIWLGLSKYSAHSLSEEVARAVADVVAEVSYKPIRFRVLFAVGVFVTLSLLYTGFVFVMLR